MWSRSICWFPSKKINSTIGCAYTIAIDRPGKTLCLLSKFLSVITMQQALVQFYSIYYASYIGSNLFWLSCRTHPLFPFIWLFLEVSEVWQPPSLIQPLLFLLLLSAVPKPTEGTIQRPFSTVPLGDHQRPHTGWLPGSLHMESSQSKGKVWPKDECKSPPLEAKTVHKGSKTKQAAITTKNFKF